MLPGRSQAGYGYAVVDLETSGSSSRRHRVVELAVVLLDAQLRPEGEFATLVDPQGPVGPTHIHGIEPGQLAGAPLFSGIAVSLLRLLDGRVLVGHNVGCDRAFLVAEFARLGVALPPVPELCTMRLAAGVGGQPADGLSLAACAAAAGLTDWNPHTALGDARATAVLLRRYAPRVPGLSELLTAAAALRGPELPGRTHPEPDSDSDSEPHPHPGAGLEADVTADVAADVTASVDVNALWVRRPLVSSAARSATSGADVDTSVDTSVDTFVNASVNAPADPTVNAPVNAPAGTRTGARSGACGGPRASACGGVRAGGGGSGRNQAFVGPADCAGGNEPERGSVPDARKRRA